MHFLTASAYIVGFLDEFVNVVVNLSQVSFGEVSFSFFRLCHFIELLFSNCFL